MFRISRSSRNSSPVSTWEEEMARPRSRSSKRISRSSASSAAATAEPSQRSFMDQAACLWQGRSVHPLIFLPLFSSVDDKLCLTLFSALKLVLIDAKPAVRKQILRELQIMHDCESDHIVSFYGAFLADPHICICMEHMDRG